MPFTTPRLNYYGRKPDPRCCGNCRYGHAVVGDGGRQRLQCQHDPQPMFKADSDVCAHHCPEDE